MKNNPNIKPIVIIAILGFMAMLYFVFNSYESSDLTKAIIQNAKKNEIIRIGAITHFEWDRAYIIEDPYISGEALNKIVGADVNIENPLTDITRRIIFINDNKLAFDYVYDLREISFMPLGSSVDNGFDRFSVDQDGKAIQLRWLPNGIKY